MPTRPPIVRLVCVIHFACVSSALGGGRVVGYFTNWAQYRPEAKFTAGDIDATLLTHLNYAFARIDPGPDRRKPVFKLAPGEWNDLGPGGQYAGGQYEKCNALKANHPQLKTLLSVGGWSFNDAPATSWIFSAMASRPESRGQFIHEAITFLRQNHFDGLDLDWEFPASPGRGGKPEDKHDLTLLLAEFRAAFAAEAAASGRAPLLLTIAAPAGADDYRHYELGEVHKSVDWINLMTYNYHGTWDAFTGANAPLLADSAAGGKQCVAATVEAYLAAGLPADKLVLGFPAFGNSYARVPSAAMNAPARGAGPPGKATGSAGYFGYFEARAWIASGKFKPGWDEASGTPFAYDAAGQAWISFDDERSLGLKLDYLEKKKLGGAMVWAIDLDDFQHGWPLMRTLAKRLQPAR